MKYELYVRLIDKNLNPINKKEAIEFLLDHSILLNLNISIIETFGSFNNFKEESLLIIHIDKNSEVDDCIIIPPPTHDIKILGDLYKNKYNQECFILNSYPTTFNVY